MLCKKASPQHALLTFVAPAFRPRKRTEQNFAFEALAEFVDLFFSNGNVVRQLVLPNP